MDIFRGLDMLLHVSDDVHPLAGAVPRAGPKDKSNAPKQPRRGGLSLTPGKRAQPGGGESVMD